MLLVFLLRERDLVTLIDNFEEDVDVRDSVMGGEGSFTVRGEIEGKVDSVKEIGKDDDGEGEVDGKLSSMIMTSLRFERDLLVALVDRERVFLVDSLEEDNDDEDEDIDREALNTDG
jgi:hypothetical protein